MHIHIHRCMWGTTQVIFFIHIHKDIHIQIHTNIHIHVHRCMWGTTQVICSIHIHKDIHIHIHTNIHIHVHRCMWGTTQVICFMITQRANARSTSGFEEMLFAHVSKNRFPHPLRNIYFEIFSRPCLEKPFLSPLFCFPTQPTKIYFCRVKFELPSTPQETRRNIVRLFLRKLIFFPPAL